MTVDLAHPFFKIFRWDVLLEVWSQLGIPDLIEKASSQCLGVGLDQPNETI